MSRATSVGVVGATLPPVAVTVEEAAAMLSMSRDSFDRHVRADLRLIRRGRLIRVPVSELARWAERESALTLGQR